MGLASGPVHLCSSGNLDCLFGHIIGSTMSQEFLQHVHFILDGARFTIYNIGTHDYLVEFGQWILFQPDALLTAVLLFRLYGHSLFLVECDIGPTIARHVACQQLTSTVQGTNPAKGHETWGDCLFVECLYCIVGPLALGLVAHPNRTLFGCLLSAHDVRRNEHGVLVFGLCALLFCIALPLHLLRGD